MTTNLLLVGNSHSACRYEAAGVFRAAGIPGENISWMCQGGNLAPFAVNAKGRTIVPRFASQTSAHINVYIRNGERVLDGFESDPGLPFDAVETIVLSSVGVRPPEVLLEKHICHYMSRVPTSDALVAAWVDGRNISRLIPNLTELREAGFSGRIFVTPWVRPFSLPEFCSPEIWARFCRIEWATLKNTLEKVQATLLPYPPGTELMTDIALTTGKTAVHGNAAYGELINKLLLDVAYPQLVERSQARAA